MTKATCHPTRRHQARGMCLNCYQKWRRENSENARLAHCSSSKKWYEANKNNQFYCFSKTAKAKAMLWTKYKLRPAILEQMYQHYERKCAVCKRFRKLVVDHNHTTGEVRGLVCYPCNVLIGQIENKEQFDSVQDYIKNHRVWSIGAVKHK